MIEVVKFLSGIVVGVGMVAIVLSIIVSIEDSVAQGEVDSDAIMAECISDAKELWLKGIRPRNIGREGEGIAIAIIACKLYDVRVGR